MSSVDEETSSAHLPCNSRLRQTITNDLCTYIPRFMNPQHPSPLSAVANLLRLATRYFHVHPPSRWPALTRTFGCFGVLRHPVVAAQAGGSCGRILRRWEDTKKRAASKQSISGTPAPATAPATSLVVYCLSLRIAAQVATLVDFVMLVALAACVALLL